LVADNRSRAAARRQALVDQVAAVADPEQRARLARAELAATEAALRGLRDQAVRDLHAILGSWEEVGQRLGLKRTTVRRWGTGQSYERRSA
jgi:hypothetical protein